MKLLITIFSTMLFSNLLIAQQTCKTYIDDEWTDSRYIVSDIGGENIVTDTGTKLMWKQCTQGLTGLDCTQGKNLQVLWNQALISVATENQDTFAGFNDWRLPNIKELQTISARNCFFPALNKTIFPNSPRLFWTSTPDNRSNDSVWVLDFKTGYDETRLRDMPLNVRLVRGGS